MLRREPNVKDDSPLSLRHWVLSLAVLPAAWSRPETAVGKERAIGNCGLRYDVHFVKFEDHDRRSDQFGSLSENHDRVSPQPDYHHVKREKK